LLCLGGLTVEVVRGGTRLPDRWVKALTLVSGRLGTSLYISLPPWRQVCCFWAASPAGTGLVVSLPVPAPPPRSARW